MVDRDDARRAAMSQLLASSTRRKGDGASRYRLAMMLHHGGLAEGAKRSALLSIGSHPKGVWLTCAVIDRQRLMRGQPQLAGTQYRIDAETANWMLIAP
jgi:hypothetical protein